MNIFVEIFVILIGIALLLITSKLSGWEKYLAWVLCIILFILQVYLIYKKVQSERKSAKSGKIESTYFSQYQLVTLLWNKSL